MVLPTSVYGGGGGGGGGSPTAGGPGGVSATDTGPLPSSKGTVNSGNATLGSGKVTLPAGCESKNGLGIRWLLDTGVSLTAITSALGGAKPCWDGYYAQITSSIWDGSQLLGKVAEVKAGGLPYPIFVASV
ncbi:hypothetical protein OEA41_002709 [Lepraria neglecta]|uniref:Uncharacterized protein n=1 Tax=Lepraria neglecta TaxID=209136 RepID=A0AAD9Z4T2_9LECA|nr:hypothetical protein OEA41_002709 [Lepraria neglecta]